MGDERNGSYDRWRYQQRGRQEYEPEYEDEEEYYDDDELAEEEYDVRPPRRQASVPPRSSYRAPRVPPSTRSSASSTRRLQPQKKRKVWPFLLLGCSLGIVLTVLAAAVVVIITIRSATQDGGLNLPGMKNPVSAFPPKVETQTVPLAGLSQMIVCNQYGSVTVQVDQDATNTVAKIEKKIQASSQSDADTVSKGISVQTQSSATLATSLSCDQIKTTTPAPADTTATPSNQSDNTVDVLILNAALPKSAAITDTVDITITIPQSIARLIDGTPKANVDIETKNGDISVAGISGKMLIKVGTGNIKVNQLIMGDGSQVSTGNGTITFNAQLAAPSDSTKKASYTLTAEIGTLNVMLQPHPNITLDANVNSGKNAHKITADGFTFTVTPTKNGGESYYGPLSATETPVNVVLTLDVGQGNITISKSNPTA